MASASFPLFPLHEESSGSWGRKTPENSAKGFQGVFPFFLQFLSLSGKFFIRKTGGKHVAIRNRIPGKIQIIRKIAHFYGCGAKQIWVISITIHIIMQPSEIINPFFPCFCPFFVFTLLFPASKGKVPQTAFPAPPDWGGAYCLQLFPIA